jgi:hypothetical protein
MIVRGWSEVGEHNKNGNRSERGGKCKIAARKFWLSLVRTKYKMKI